LPAAPTGASGDGSLSLFILWDLRKEALRFSHAFTFLLDFFLPFFPSLAWMGRLDDV
jgi:hypothetical protein